MAAEDSVLLSRRSRLKRRFPLTPAAKHSTAVDQQCPVNESEDFSSLNESDLLLASLADNADVWTSEEEKQKSPRTDLIKIEECNTHGVSKYRTRRSVKSSSTSISDQTSQAYLEDGSMNYSKPMCSPEQDLFDDGDRLSPVCDNEKNPCKTFEEGSNSKLNDSFSDIFFRKKDESEDSEQNSIELKTSLSVAAGKPCTDQASHRPFLDKQVTVIKSSSPVEDHVLLSRMQPTVTTQTKPGEGHNTSLKDKLKQRLQMNTGVSSCQKKIEEEIKKEVLQQARIDASQIRREGTDVDIGPFYGLPTKVQQLLEVTRGITKLYEWQAECLQLQALKDRRNLIYSLPTSGGKTLVAEILIMRELLCYKRDALIVLPFVSIVQEKVRSIAEFSTELGFIVEEYAGSKGRFPPVKRREKKSLYIATIEKAHSLVNSLIETKRMSALGLVVVDELHMIGEGGSRGANLESMLLKIVISEDNTQIIGMSATLNNIKDLQSFLQADIYSNNFRPVSLIEYVKVEDNIFSVNNKALNDDDKLEHERIITFPYASDLLKKDPDHLLGLVLEVIPDNSCLVFCSTKKNCENVALMLSKLMNKQHRHLTNVKRDKRKQLLLELSQDGQGNVCPVLEYTVHFGLAYHHSGLTMDERRLLEDAYADGTLCLLACTSTLAAGVNLPAKRVILRSPYVGMNLIKHSQYKQMVGRAGRAGIDTSGESFLIVKRQDRMKVKELLAGPEDVCHSSLAYDDAKGVKTLLLSAIGLQVVTSTKSAVKLMQQSLLHIQSGTLNVDVDVMTEESIKYLLDQGLVTQVTPSTRSEQDFESCNLCVTSVGKATFKGSVDHTYSSQLYKDLKSAESALNLATYLHLLYLVTPYDTALTVTPLWDIYFKKYCNLSEVEAKVASVVGVPESYLGLRAAGRSSKRKICPLTVNRFYLTLMLWDLWNQRTVWEVADTFSQTRGFIQNLLSQAAAFASCVLHFCQELEEFWAYEQLLNTFVKRLAHCVSSELIPLMEVPGVKMARAKQLYAAGFRSVAALAAATETSLVKSIEYMSRQGARQIISAAKNILEEKTAVLMEEVDLLTALETENAE